MKSHYTKIVCHKSPGIDHIYILALKVGWGCGLYAGYSIPHRKGKFSFIKDVFYCHQQLKQRKLLPHIPIYTHYCAIALDTIVQEALWMVGSELRKHLKEYLYLFLLVSIYIYAK